MPHDTGSLRQNDRPPEVMRATFPLIPAAYTSAVSVQVSGSCALWVLKIMAFLPTATAYYAIPVRRASVLPSAFFRFHLAMDTLAVRLIVPLA
ncbi:hypothetical protein GZ78_09640 [Endozoicomonas numazuensis]|uniref:Uncharacterized protein n=1 Tax=Endozoicomonas numazuensis TaxID=1137799 RepID=A0A081NHG9_9GAMM|nr:hypothetical protein GZ78_09640 [Endozoicomonas numazuensis]